MNIFHKKTLCEAALHLQNLAHEITSETPHINTVRALAILFSKKNPKLSENLTTIVRDLYDYRFIIEDDQLYSEFLAYFDK